MDLLTRDDIRSLAASDADGMHVSLFMPTHRFGGEVQADQVRWKNLVGGVESLLLQELRRPDVEALLAPARELQSDSLAWQNMSDGLAMFLSPGRHQVFRIPASLPTLATAGDHFVTGPLMRLLSGDAPFLLLAISQGEVRLMDGSRHTVRQIELEDVPTALADVVEPAGPRSDAMARTLSGGRGGRAVFYGHGAGDDDAKKDDLMRFLRQVASGLHEVLAGQTAPLVLAGLEQNVSAYRDVNTYHGVLDEAVLRNPDDLSADELHRLAWPLVEQRLRDERTALIDRFHEMNGTGKVYNDLAVISAAAAQGRVDTLFMRSAPWCWERVAEAGEAPVVRLGADERFVVCEEVDKAAVDTLAYGGQVHATSQEVAGDSEVAAILRY